MCIFLSDLFFCFVVSTHARSFHGLVWPSRLYVDVHFERYFLQEYIQLLTNCSSMLGVRVEWSVCDFLVPLCLTENVIRRFHVFAHAERSDACSNPDVRVNPASVAASLVFSLLLHHRVYMLLACLPREEGYHGLERVRESDQLRSAGVRQDGEGDAPRRPAVEDLPSDARREPLLGRLRRQGSLRHPR